MLQLYVMLSMFTGHVVNVDEDRACFWMACDVCGGDSLTGGTSSKWVHINIYAHHSLGFLSIFSPFFGIASCQKLLIQLQVPPLLDDVASVLFSPKQFYQFKQLKQIYLLCSLEFTSHQFIYVRSIVLYFLVPYSWCVDTNTEMQNFFVDENGCFWFNNLIASVELTLWLKYVWNLTL